MSKNIKKLITMCALFALILSLAVPTAFANSKESKASVDYGSTQMAYGGDRTLYGYELKGKVQSQTANTDTIVGYMYTKGVLWTHKRDEATTKNGNHATMSWANSSGDTGTYWAQCRAKSGKQEGYCLVYQE